jgi:hypothetical protein
LTFHRLLREIFHKIFLKRFLYIALHAMDSQQYISSTLMDFCIDFTEMKMVVLGTNVITKRRIALIF